MKQIFLATLLFVTIGAQAQIKKPNNISLGESKKQVGSVMPLAEGQTYKIVFPERAIALERNYRSSRGQLETGGLDMKAKRQASGATDYTFVIVSPGLQNIEQGNVVMHQNTAKVVPFVFNFPGTLEVRDKDGALLKTFVLSPDDKAYGTLFHAGFFNEKTMKRPDPYMNIVGFNRKNEWIQASIDSNRREIYDHIEYRMYKHMVHQAATVIRLGFGYPRVLFKPQIMELHKKDKPNFPELQQAVEKLAAEVEQAFPGPISDTLREALMASGAYFESQYTPKSPKEMIQLCALNATVGYMLAGDIKKAEPHKDRVDRVFGTFSGAKIATFGIYEQIVELEQVSQGIVPATIEHIMEKEEVWHEEFAIKEMKRYREEQAHRELLYSINVKREPGYIIKKDGTREEGIISIQFVTDPDSDMRFDPMDWGTTLAIKVGDKKPKEYKAKQIQQVVLTNRKDTFTSVNVGALDNSFINVRGGALQIGTPNSNPKNMSGFYYMTLAATRNGCSLYLFLKGETIQRYVLKEGDKNAVPFTELLENKKPTKKYIGDCPVLQEKLDAKDISNNNAGATQFIEALGECLGTN
jgi:hypothetical protein